MHFKSTWNALKQSTVTFWVQIFYFDFGKPSNWWIWVKFTYSEKATKVCEIFTLLLSYVVPVKSKVKTLLNCVVFSEYMNFNLKIENNRTWFFFSFIAVVKGTAKMKISSNRKDSTREDDDIDGHDSMTEARSPSNSISSQHDPVQPPPVKEAPKSPGPASTTSTTSSSAAAVASATLAAAAALPPQVPSAATTASSKPSKSQSSTSAASS